MRASRVFLLVACLPLAGCGHGQPQPAQPASADAPAKPVPAGAATLRSATKVEVFRIDGSDLDPGKEPDRAAKAVGGYPVIAQGPDQGAVFAGRLADVLGDRATYTDRYAKCFWPGVAFRAWKGGECVEVLICFQCDNLYVGPPQDRARENATFHGSPRRRDLVRLAKEALPDDKDIQALKDE
jgi:hypothetical protein